MAESFQVIHGAKAEQYEHALTQIEQLLANETNLIANMANVCAVLKAQFGWHWVGFYLTDPAAGNLVLGPFQGPLACSRIPYGKGVCGTAFETALTQIVPNVHAFPGHIACSSLSNSEIVVPLIKQQAVWAVLDIDSIHFSDFDSVDKTYLERLAALITQAK